MEDTYPGRSHEKNLLMATGRPGPATWEIGDYPDGKDDYPYRGLLVRSSSLC